MSNWVYISALKRTIRKTINKLREFHLISGGMRVSSIINHCEKNPSWENLCNLEHLLTKITNAFLKNENVRKIIFHFGSEVCIVSD